MKGKKGRSSKFIYFNEKQVKSHQGLEVRLEGLLDSSLVFRQRSRYRIPAQVTGVTVFYKIESKKKGAKNGRSSNDR